MYDEKYSEVYLMEQKGIMSRCLVNVIQALNTMLVPCLSLDTGDSSIGPQVLIQPSSRLLGKQARRVAEGGEIKDNANTILEACFTWPAFQGSIERAVV